MGNADSAQNKCPLLMSKEEPPTQSTESSATLEELRANVKAGVKKKHFEDDHKKASYWLTPREIKMVNEMAKAAGKDKYEIVGFAIRELYRQVFEG